MVRVDVGNMGKNGDNGDQGQGWICRFQNGTKRAKTRIRNRNVTKNKTGVL